MNELKKYYCKICKKELIPREKMQTINKKISNTSASEKYFEKNAISLHHINYQKNIAIRVCKSCHNKLHTTMKKHQYGYYNIIRRDGSKKGRLSPGKYPKKIID